MGWASLQAQRPPIGVCVNASRHLDCLIYVHEHGAPLVGNFMVQAAFCGRLEILVYAHEHGAAWDAKGDECSYAAAGGHMDCLVYAHEHGAAWGNVCYFAAQQGRIDMMVYAHDRGAPMRSIGCM